MEPQGQGNDIGDQRGSSSLKVIKGIGKEMRRMKNRPVPPTHEARGPWAKKRKKKEEQTINEDVSDNE